MVLQAREGRNDLLEYLRTLEPMSISQLTSNAGDDVVEAMNQFVARLLGTKDPEQLKQINSETTAPELGRQVVPLLPRGIPHHRIDLLRALQAPVLAASRGLLSPHHGGPLRDGEDADAPCQGPARRQRRGRRSRLINPHSIPSLFVWLALWTALLPTPPLRSKRSPASSRFARSVRPLKAGPDNGEYLFEGPGAAFGCRWGKRLRDMALGPLI